MEVLDSEEEAAIEQAFGLSTNVSADAVITAGGAGHLLEVVLYDCCMIAFTYMHMHACIHFMRIAYMT